MGRKLGYFIKKQAKHGFVGAIGGRNETLDISQLYEREIALLKIENQNPDVAKVEKENPQDFWDTALLTNLNIPSIWKEHWWTYEEIQSVIFQMDEKLKQINSVKELKLVDEGTTREPYGQEAGKSNTITQMPSPILSKKQLKAAEFMMENQNNNQSNTINKNVAFSIRMVNKESREESSTLNELVCDQCKRPGVEHNHTEWLSCDNCARSFVKECITIVADQTSIKKCEQCITTTLKLKKLVASDLVTKTEEILEKLNLNTGNTEIILRANALQSENAKLKGEIKAKTCHNKELQEELLKQNKIIIDLTTEARQEKDSTHVHHYVRTINSQKRRIDELEQENIAYKGKTDKSEAKFKQKDQIISELQGTIILMEKRQSTINPSEEQVIPEEHGHQNKGQVPMVIARQTDDGQVNVAKTPSQPWGDMESSQSESDEYFKEMARKVALSNSESEELDISRYTKTRGERLDLIVHKESSTERRVETVTSPYSEKEQYQRMKRGFREGKHISENEPKKPRHEGPHYPESSEGVDRNNQKGNSRRESKKDKSEDRRDSRTSRTDNRYVEEYLLKHPKWIITSDSLLKSLMINKGLNVTAFKNNWEVRVIRGGTTENIADFLDSESTDRMTGAEILLVSAGSNDMAQVNRKNNHDISKRIHLVKSQINHIITENKFRAKQIVFLLPPPREDVDEDVRRKFVYAIAETCHNLGAETLDIPNSSENPAQFITKIMSDGIHPGMEQVSALIEELAHISRTEVIIESPDKDFCFRSFVPQSMLDLWGSPQGPPETFKKYSWL